MGPTSEPTLAPTEALEAPTSAPTHAPTEESWPQFGAVNSRCRQGTAIRGITQFACQQTAIERGHGFYAYAAVADEDSSCRTSANCDVIVGTDWDWKIYKE